MTTTLASYGGSFNSSVAQFSQTSVFSYQPALRTKVESIRPSREQLFKATAEKVYRQAFVSLDNPLSPRTHQTIESALKMLWYLLEDGCATPQVDFLSDGGVAIHWLVKQQSVNIIVSSEANIQVWCEDENGHEIVCVETTNKWTKARELEQIKAYLKVISNDVLTRVQ